MILAQKILSIVENGGERVRRIGLLLGFLEGDVEDETSVAAFRLDGVIASSDAA